MYGECAGREGGAAESAASVVSKVHATNLRVVLMVTHAPSL